MALAVTHKSDVFTTTNATSYATTTSFTPTTASLLLAWVTSSKASAPDTPTFSGNGLTWTQVGSAVLYTSVAAPSKVLTVFSAIGTGGSAGVQTASYGANTETGCCIIVDEWLGADTSSPIVQTVVANTDAISGSGSVTLAALANTANRPVAGYGVNDNTVAITSTDTLIAQGSYATPVTGLATAWSPTSDLTINFSAAAARWACIGLELRSSTPDGTAFPFGRKSRAYLRNR